LELRHFLLCRWHPSPRTSLPLLSCAGTELEETRRLLATPPWVARQEPVRHQPRLFTRWSLSRRQNGVATRCLSRGGREGTGNREQGTGSRLQCAPCTVPHESPWVHCSQCCTAPISPSFVFFADGTHLLAMPSFPFLSSISLLSIPIPRNHCHSSLKLQARKGRLHGRHRDCMHYSLAFNACISLIHQPNQPQSLETPAPTTLLFLFGD